MPQTILLIDDEADLRNLVTKRLSHFGYQVLTAESGEEGLQLAEAHHPDLVLLDIMMPKMKGRDVYIRLKANPATRKIPVIFLTGLGLTEHVKAGLDLGAEDYIIKPFDPLVLQERVAVCLARHRIA